MDSQSHKITAASTGHEVHGVHICHRCGWPFPNPHPSAKHRRSHKRVCGNVDGYKIIHSEKDDHLHHIAVSDDDKSSDEDGHTPNPKLVMKNSGEFGSISSGVGEKSNKSEDDVFSDAVADFSDSGISPRIELKSVEDDLYRSQLLEVDDNTDKTKQLNDPPSSDQIVISSNENGDEGLHKGLMKTGQDQVEEDKLASNPQTLIEVERKEEICDKLASESPTNKDASAEEKNVADSAEVSHFTETVGDMALTEEISVNVDTFVELQKVSESVKQETNEYSDGVSVFPSIDKEIEQNTSLVGNSDISECEIAGNENRKMGSNDKVSVESVSQDDQASRDLGKDSNHFDDKSNSKLLEAGNESSKGTTGEVQLTLDSETPTVNSTDVPSSGVDNLGAGNLEELSKTESNSVETNDNSFEKSYQEFDTDFVLGTSNVHVTKDDVIVESVDVAEVKDNEDVTASVRIPENPISKESRVLSKNEDVADNNICTSDGVTSIDAAEVITELNHDNNDVILSESSKGPTSRLQEALPVNEKCSSPDVEEKHTSEDVSISKSFGVNVVTSNNLSENPSTEERIHETCATDGDKNITNGEHVNALNSNCDTPTEQEDDDLSNSRSDSLEANCGSVSALSSQSNVAVADTSSRSPDTLKTTTNKAFTEKSDLFEPPSFMTLVQSSEIETVHNNQQPKPDDALEVGWFPSITNVVNESEGRKKNEEIIAKVTNWNPVKQHSPLKNLLNEVDSPNTKQIPKDNGKSIMAPETNKVMEEWNSPASYPIEIKKEKKKKGKTYWVPFVCCSSIHRDM